MKNNKDSRRSFIQKGLVAGLTGGALLSTFGQGLHAAVDRQSSYSNPSDLKITDVKCGYVRGALYVKIYTNQDV